MNGDFIMSTECIAIVGGIATIFAGFGGATLGAWFAYKAGIKLIQRQQFERAAAEFRNAFIPETTFIKYNANVGGLGSSDDLNEVLSHGYLRHLKAIEIFKPHLITENKRYIEQAWREYCHHPETDILWFEQYSWRVANKGNDYEKQLKDMALSRIEKILKFAEPI